MWRRVFLLLGIALASPEPLSAQNVFLKVAGVVKKVDVEVGSITVRPSRKGAVEDETFSLLKRDIDITAPTGEKIKLEAVAPGQTVQLKFDEAGDVESITIQANAFLATVAEVDIKGRIITLAGDNNRAAKMAVDPAARILMVGRTAYLREVKPGSQMNVSVSLDGKKALALNLVSDPDGKLATKLYPRIKTTRLPGVRWAGIVSEVNPAKSELHLTGPNTRGVPKRMPVAKEAVIQMIYGQVAVEKLSLGQVARMTRATVMVSPFDQQITRILVHADAIPATVKNLDPERGLLTVAMDGNEKVFELPTDVKVMDKSRVKRLVDLQANRAVSLVLSMDRERLLAVDLQ